MGKIRVKALGDEELEQKQKKEAEARKAKKVQEKIEPVLTAKEPVSETKKPVVSKYAKKVGDRKPARSHSHKYVAVAEKVDKHKIYSLSEAVTLLPELSVAKFDETVELHINTREKGISGNISLPHGTGKQVRVVIASDAIIADVEKGKIDFDVLLAEPSMMPKLAKVARILGPRGLMPNPKNGTVTPKPEEAAKKFEAGQVNFKTESKFPILHMSVGKVSFGDKKLVENITVAIQAVQLKNIKNVTLKSTMSPGLRLDVSSL